MKCEKIDSTDYDQFHDVAGTYRDVFVIHNDTVTCVRVRPEYEQETLSETIVCRVAYEFVTGQAVNDTVSQQYCEIVLTYSEQVRRSTREYWMNQNAGRNAFKLPREIEEDFDNFYRFGC